MTRSGIYTPTSATIHLVGLIHLDLNLSPIQVALYPVAHGRRLGLVNLLGRSMVLQSLADVICACGCRLKTKQYRQALVEQVLPAPRDTGR